MDKIQPEHAPILIGRVGLSPHDDTFVKDYPTLAQLLFPRYADGKHLTREAGILTVKVDSSLYRVTLVCPTEGVQLTVNLSTLSDLLLSMEVHCSDPKSDWVKTWDAKKKQRRRLDSSSEDLYTTPPVALY